MSDTVRHAETVFFLGESHALGFAERVVLRDDEPPLMCQPLFLVNGVSFDTIAAADGKLSGQVRSLLRASRLIVDFEHRERALLDVPHLQWQRVARRRFSRPPLIVLTLGSYDIFKAVDAFPGDDFHMPEHVPMHSLAPSLAPAVLPTAVSVDHAATWATGRVKPLQNALRHLRALGFARLALLSVVPPTIDDAFTARAVRALGGDASSPRVRCAFRYKIALFLNGLMAEVCDAENVPFLDSWPLLTHDGLQRLDMFEDQTHLNDRGIEEVLLRLVAPAAAREPVATVDAT